jgi:hypothetical protein
VSEPAPEDVAAPTVEKAAKASRRGRGRTRTAAKTEEVAVVEALAPPVEPPAKAPPTPPAFSAGVLGLPETPEEITGYLTTKYKGIGKKTVETLLGRFGVGVFAALQERPEDVRSALDERRGNALLEQWAADYAKRSAAVAPAPTPDAEPVTAPAKRSRGGRGGGRKPAARKPAS